MRFRAKDELSLPFLFCSKHSICSVTFVQAAKVFMIEGFLFFSVTIPCGDRKGWRMMFFGTLTTSDARFTIFLCIGMNAPIEIESPVGRVNRVNGVKFRLMMSACVE